MLRFDILLSRQTNGFPHELTVLHYWLIRFSVLMRTLCQIRQLDRPINEGKRMLASFYTVILMTL